MDHRQLCDLAVRWLKRPNSSGGHGCHVAVSECRGGWSGETPDAIGFRAAGWHDGSIVVECKVSRADYLADKGKLHRSQGGMGNWRYYLAPEGVIRPDELPQGWGLLVANKRGHIKPVAGAAAHFAGRYDVMIEQLVAWRQEGNTAREQFLLVKLLSRVGDPEKVNRSLAAALTDRNRLAGIVNDLHAELDRERTRRWIQRLDQANEHTGVIGAP